ncbi:hypothetical protein FPSE5266_08808 [Fusarium pseudograminearum]|nr:hypothetical protein FPSE5266_08808 [Fusarium pseudograminearum]
MPLQHNVSALARSTIKIAYDELDRTINPDDKRSFANISLQDVRDAALKIENQLAARQSLRNMRRLMPLFRGLEHYSKVVDVLCNGTPFLPWIWAPITLILRISSEFVEAFEEIIKGYASIAESLKRFEILSDALINEPDFQQTVAVFYADILKFHKYAYKFVRRSGWKLIFSASWGRFQRKFGNILDDLKHHGALIDLEANAHNISQAKKMRDDIRKWREESEHRVRQDDNEQSAKQYGSIVSWLKFNDVDQLAIVDSISSEVEKYQGTCGWILQNKRIRSWADAKPNTPALWLKGSAGTGKSVLCTQLINFLKETKFVIWHFCTYLYATSTMYEQILKSLLLQILRKDADLVAYVYKTCVMERKSPTTTVLEQLLQKLLESMSSEPNQVDYVWVIIDGLDECDSDKQLRLVRLINQLTSKPVIPGSTACKVLISSRAPSDSLERLMRKQIVSLSEEKSVLNMAVRQYVDQRLESMETKLRQLNIQHANIVEIQEAIVIKSDGMFLYARLVMDYLSSNIFFGGHEIKESVNQLPRKLSDFFYPGLSPDELESFIVNFGTAAYTCRLTSCSYATIGFDTAEHLMEHEREHIRRFQCAVPGCQYPPLVSKAALESHMKRNHNPVITSKPILRHLLASKRNGSKRSQVPSRETFVNREQIHAPQSHQNEQLAMLDSMDLPPQVLKGLHNQIPPKINKWGPLKAWLIENKIPRRMRKQLESIQQKQFQLLSQRRAKMPPGQHPKGDQEEQQQLSSQQDQHPQQSQEPGQNDAGPDSQMAQSLAFEPWGSESRQMAQSSTEPRKEGLNVMSLLNDDPPPSQPKEVNSRPGTPEDYFSFRPGPSDHIR